MVPESAKDPLLPQPLAGALGAEQSYTQSGEQLGQCTQTLLSPHCSLPLYISFLCSRATGPRLSLRSQFHPLSTDPAPWSP